jgi:fatty-acyl-CoA synthase
VTTLTNTEQGVSDGLDGELWDPSWLTMRDGLLAWAQGPRDEVVVTFRRRRTPPRALTRADIVERQRAEVDALREAGLRQGDRVVLALPTSPEFIVAFWACQALGMVAVPSYPTMGPQGSRTTDRFHRILQVAEPAAVRCDPRLHEELLARGTDSLLLPTPEPSTATDCSEPAVGDIDIHPDDPALLQFTSGSTSEPRGCELSHRAILHNVRALVSTLGLRPGDTGVNWCPLYHDMGLVGSVVLPVAGLQGAILDPADFVMNPLGWLLALSEHRAAVTMAPNFAFALVERKLRGKPPPDIDLSCVRAIVNGGEPIDPGTVEAFVAALEPCGLDPEAIRPAWGMAETTLMATCSTGGLEVDVIDRDRAARGEAVPAPAADGSVRVVGLGRPVGGAEICVRGSDGRPLEERRVGEVTLRSPSLMTRYVPDQPHALEAGWLATGDLGYVADGVLHLLGRTKELVIIAGRNIAPVDVERAVAELPAVRAGGVAAIGCPRDGTEQLVVVAEVVRPPEGFVAEVRARCREAVGVVPREVVLVMPRSLPKTSSGKLRRLEVRDRYLAGALELVPGPPAEPAPRG